MTTTVGIRSKDGVVLAADKRASKGFFVGSKVVQKIFALDGATAVAIAGAMSDAEYLVNGAITSEDFMSSGSGSPIAYGVLEQGFRKEFTLDEAKKLAEAAVRAAMERDPGSGNGVDVLAIPNGHAFGEAN
jgi:20S proteasome alpha/beta subunit